MSDSLQPHGLHGWMASPTPRAYSNSCPLSQWCHPTISFSVIPFSSCLQLFPVSGLFTNESVLCIRWPKYWSFRFSISPSNEYSGLISFRMDWLDLLAVQGTLKSLLQHHSSKASILQVLKAGALGRPRGMGWGGRWEGGSGWGTHVNPWLIHVNVWEKPLQYCKVISLQLIKINEKK